MESSAWLFRLHLIVLLPIVIHFKQIEPKAGLLGSLVTQNTPVVSWIMCWICESGLIEQIFVSTQMLMELQILAYTEDRFKTLE